MRSSAFSFQNQHEPTTKLKLDEIGFHLPLARCFFSLSNRFKDPPDPPPQGLVIQHISTCRPGFACLLSIFGTHYVEIAPFITSFVLDSGASIQFNSVQFNSIQINSISFNSIQCQQFFSGLSGSLSFGTFVAKLVRTTIGRSPAIALDWIGTMRK